MIYGFGSPPATARGRTAGNDDEVRRQRDQLGHVAANIVGFAQDPAVFDRQVIAAAPAEFSFLIRLGPVSSSVWGAATMRLSLSPSTNDCRSPRQIEPATDGYRRRGGRR
jgi:hypothetical protein